MLEITLHFKSFKYGNYVVKYILRTLYQKRIDELFFHGLCNTKQYQSLRKQKTICETHFLPLPLV